MQEPNAKQAHLAHLDGLRAALAIYVLIHHGFLTIWPDGVAPQPYGHFLVWLRFGRLAVNWFIVLSGFCLMLPLLRSGYTLRGGTLNFYWRRARRILPTFYAALIFSTILSLTILNQSFGTHWKVSIPVTRASVLSNVLLIQDLWERWKINHAFWSIAVEWRIYFIFPLVAFLWRKYGGVFPTAILVCLLIAMSFGLVHINSRFEYGQDTFDYAASFVLGAFAAAAAYGQYRTQALRWIPALTALALAATALAIFQQFNACPRRLRVPPIADLTFTIAAASWLICWCAPDRSFVRSVLGSRQLAAIGVFAYSIYLIHAPVVQLSWQYCVAPLHLQNLPALGMLYSTSVPASIVAAYLFYLAFEKPFTSTRQRIAAKQELPAIANLAGTMPVAVAEVQ